MRGCFISAAGPFFGDLPIERESASVHLAQLPFAEMEEERTSCRLSDAVVPVKYSLIYHDLDLDRCTFTGSVVILCKVSST